MEPTLNDFGGVVDVYRISFRRLQMTMLIVIVSIETRLKRRKVLLFCLYTQ